MRSAASAGSSAAGRSDRHLGRGYSLAGFYHPRSRMSEDTGYDGMLHGFNRQIEFWRATFDARKPALVINTAKIPTLIARRLGVPMRRLAASRFRNLYCWAHNEFLESREIADAFASLPRDAGLDIEGPAEGHLQARAATSRSLSLAGASREAATILLQRLYWRARGYTKGRSYYMRDEIAMALRQYRDMRRLQRQARTTLAGRPWAATPCSTSDQRRSSGSPGKPPCGGAMRSASAGRIPTANGR